MHVCGRRRSADAHDLWAEGPEGYTAMSATVTPNARDPLDTRQLSYVDVLQARRSHHRVGTQRCSGRGCRILGWVATMPACDLRVEASRREPYRGVRPPRAFIIHTAFRGCVGRRTTPARRVSAPKQRSPAKVRVNADLVFNRASPSLSVRTCHSFPRSGLQRGAVKSR